MDRPCTVRNRHRAVADPLTIAQQCAKATADRQPHSVFNCHTPTLLPKTRSVASAVSCPVLPVGYRTPQSTGTSPTEGRQEKQTAPTKYTDYTAAKEQQQGQARSQQRFRLLKQTHDGFAIGNALYGFCYQRRDRKLTYACTGTRSL